MSKFRRPFVILLSLCLLLIGGQLDVCACSISPSVPPAHESCASADHQHGRDHGSEKPGSHAGCACSECHGCSHGIAVISLNVAMAGSCGALPNASELPQKLVQVDAKITIPPRLS